MCLPSSEGRAGDVKGGKGAELLRRDPSSPAAQGKPSSLESHPAGDQGKRSCPSSPTQRGATLLLWATAALTAQLSLGHTFPPPLPHQSVQLPHTPSEGLEETHGQHLQVFNPHPGCSITTSVRNPATSSASQTLSLAWQSPDLGKPCLAKPPPVPGPQKHDITTEIKPVTAKGQTRALWILSNTKPNSGRVTAALATAQPLKR